MAYEFHYTPTGTGVISGKEVLEQTEDAINDLGNTAISGVQEALDKAEQALTNSANAVDDAQTALNTANNAEGVAIQAQNDVGNLSGTVTNIGNRVTTAEGNISNLQGRMTTAEGNITNIQGRMTTAETNIGNLQTAVSTAQATANSAQQTATTARQQSYVLRYSSASVTDNSTIAYSTLDNTDNIKSGDKVIDVDGKIFSVVSVDTTNQTVTVGSALIDLALDANVVHTSGNETINGVKSFINYFLGKDLSGQTVDLNNCVDAYGGAIHYYYALSNYTNISNKPENKPFILKSKTVRYVSSIDYIYYQKIYTADYNAAPSIYTRYYRSGSASWSNWIKDTDKFVTTDTAQTISGSKTFSSNVNVYNSDSSTDTANIILKNSKTERGSTTNIGEQTIFFLDKDNAQIGNIKCEVDSSGVSTLNIQCTNSSNSSSGIRLRRTSTGTFLHPTFNNGCNLGTTGYRWYDVQTRAVNNLEPSSLGMPVAPSTTSYVDISGYITVLDSSSANTYTPPSNGYITFSVTGNLVQIFHDYGLQGKWTVQAGNANRGFIPVLGGVEVKIYITASSVDKFWFIPCQGNI